MFTRKEEAQANHKPHAATLAATQALAPALQCAHLAKAKPSRLTSEQRVDGHLNFQHGLKAKRRPLPDIRTLK